MRRRFRKLSLLAVAAIVALAATSSFAQYREYVSLGADKSTGIWTFTPLVAKDYQGNPATFPPGPITVPGWWSDHNPDWDDDWPNDDPRDKHIEQAQYTRIFEVPASMTGKRIKLFFGEVNHSAEVSVNWQLVGPKHYQGNVPFEYDITDFVNPGYPTLNTLDVVVWDHNDLRNPSNMAMYLYPFGHPMWANKMNGIAQDVILYAVPKIYVKDVFVITSVEHSEITLKITIANEDTVAHTVDIENDIRKITQVRPELSVLERTLNSSSPTTVNAGEEVEVVLADTWSNPTLWWPHDPQLYRLHTRLVESGTPIDEKTDVRFGFREIKVDGARYNLNGVPFHGWGDTDNTMNCNLWLNRDMVEYRLDTMKAYGVRLMRHGAALPPPQLLYDLCDEKGLLVYAEMTYNGQNEGGTVNGVTIYHHDYGNPTFEANVATMAETLTKHYRNHPSIIIWSIENEVFYGGQPSYNATTRQRVADIRAVIDAEDGTRPVGVDSDGSLSGLLEIKNKHYPGSVANVNDDGPAKAYTNWSNNSNIYWVTGIDPPTVPLGVGEYMFNKTPSGNRNNIQCPSNWGRLKALQLRAYRLAGFSDIRPFTLGHENLSESWSANSVPYSTRNSHMLMKKSMFPVAVFDHDYDGMGVYEIRGMDVPTYAEGTLVTRTYDVYNDDMEDLNTDITINWEVRIYDRVTDSGTQVVSVPIADVDQVDLSWTVPEVNATTPFVVGVEARKSGRQVFDDFRIFKATDAGGSTVSGLGQFRADFDGAIPTGFKDYDTWWKKENGEFVMPELRGLDVSNIAWYKSSIDDRVFPTDPYSYNAKMAAIEAYTFDDFRASFDVRALDFDDSYMSQWAGMGFRMAHPEDSPYEKDKTRRTGYYVAVQRLGNTDYDGGGQSNWRLVVGETSPTESLTVLGQQRIPVPGGQFVRVEVDFSGGDITAIANNDRGSQVSVTDTTYTSGYAGLVMSQRIAAAYDNVAVGPGPFAPWASVPASHDWGDPVTVQWGAEADAVEYMVEWSSDGFATVGGSSGWITGLSHVFAGLPMGVIYFRVYSRDAEGRESNQSAIVTTTVDIGPSFEVRKSDGTRLALFDSEGNLYLKGTLTESSTPRGTTASEFMVKDQGGVIVAGVFGSGDMHIRGTSHANQSTLTPPAGSFVIKNVSADVVAYISPSGDLYTKGDVIPLADI